MARGTRDTIKRKAEQAQNDLLRAVANCYDILAIYEAGAYEQIAFFTALARTLTEMADVLEKYRQTRL